MRQCAHIFQFPLPICNGNYMLIFFFFFFFHFLSAVHAFKHFQWLYIMYNLVQWPNMYIVFSAVYYICNFFFHFCVICPLSLHSCQEKMLDICLDSLVFGWVQCFPLLTLNFKLAEMELVSFFFVNMTFRIVYQMQLRYCLSEWWVDPS